MGSVAVPPKKYRSEILDRRLTWVKHIKIKKTSSTQKRIKYTGYPEEGKHCNRKQTPPIQSSTETNLGSWHSAMWDTHKLKHQNPPVLPIQNSPMLSECTLVHKQQQDT
jgi:hypothetical protein